MKATRILFALVISLLFIGNLSKAQTFDVYIANDAPTSSTVYEFDVFIRSTSSTTWAFRTIQFGFYVNPAWLPAGPSPTISYIAGSTGLNFYSPGLIQMNASPSSLSAFQIAANSAGTCGTNTVFTSVGQTAKVGRFRITSNSGPMNCTPSNISMIRPITSDVTPGGNVNLKMAVTRWTDPICLIGTSTTISTNGTYTTVSGGTLLSEFNNMAPPITGNPVNFSTCETGTAVFTVSAIPNIGQAAPLTYQWKDNGVAIPGANSPTLTIPNASLSINGHVFTCTVTQCNSRTSSGATLAIQGINDGNVCTVDACDVQTSIITHTAVDPNDNNACTTDACDPILGVTHTAVNTDDGNPLTIDLCDPVTGVYHYFSLAIPYQAIARNSSGNVVPNQYIAIRFSIRETTPGGNIIYREIHYVVTNTLGLFTLNIGHGSPVVGTFSGIDWSGIVKYLQVEMDITGGNAFTDMGTQQMLSVPYAFYAVQSGSIANKIAFSAYNSGSISLPSATITQVIFNSSLYNYRNGFNSANGKFTAPESGLYHFNTNINFNLPAAETEAKVRYYKNGIQASGGLSSRVLSSIVGSGSSVSFPFDLDLNQGDVIDVRVEQTGAAALSIYGGTASGCTFSGYKVN